MLETVADYKAEIADYLELSKPLARYPGVTKVLGGTKDMSGLDAWRERVGAAEADRIVEESKQIGLSLDTMFNDRLGKPDEFVLENYKGTLGYPLYRQLDPFIKKIEPIQVQMKVWNDRLRYMGYLDCFGFYKGKLAVIDCKNSKREKKEEYLEDYYLQCTAYSMALYEMLGFMPKTIVLLIARRDSSFPQVIERNIAPYIPQVIARTRLYHESNPA